MLLAALLAFQTATAPGAELVAPGVINTEADEYGPTLTPDARTLVFTHRLNHRGDEELWMSRAEGDGWLAPERLPFTAVGDKEPAFSPDGRWLFFSSTRPWDGKPAPPESLRAGALVLARSDLWMVERRPDGWGTPRPVPGGVNTNVYENYPSAAASGALYWAGYRDGGAGRNDLWMAPRNGDEWSNPVNLAELNTPHTDADPFIAPDETYIIFSSDRPGGAGQGDLYVSRRERGRWGAPVALGPLVNSDDYEYTPWVSADGRWLWFSRGWGEIWRIETRLVPALGFLR